MNECPHWDYENENPGCDCDRPLITVRRTTDAKGWPLYVASGPGEGDRDLLARGTRDAAERDGLAYYRRTRG